MAFTTSNGDLNYLPSAMDLFLPETDSEIAMGMVSLKSNEEEILIFRPMLLRLDAAVLAKELPEEVEEPEVDR